ncbi:hypothetical protein BX604_1413 [Burkholderia sp. JKS000303]|nr:hypothetical protein BX604_1413 [Burkholderia sp. JKS000303]
MLSCRGVKAPLIFVSVLMHRETNLQVENEETIEAQSARTPKRCWTESNSAFSFVCVNYLRWCSGRRRRFATASAFRLPRVSRPSSRSSPFPQTRRTWRAATRMPFGLTRLACAKSVRYTQLSPTARSGKSVGSSPTSKMQKREHGWMRSAGRRGGATGAAGAARSCSGRPGSIPAVANRPAAGMRVLARFARTTVPPVVVSASESSIACA